jgi:hypothetical protein
MAIVNPHDILNVYIDKFNVVNYRDIQLANIKFDEKDQILLDDELRGYSSTIPKDLEVLEKLFENLTKKSSKFAFILKLLNSDLTTDHQELISDSESLLIMMQVYPFVIMAFHFQKKLFAYWNEAIKDELLNHKERYVDVVHDILDKREENENNKHISRGLVDLFYSDWFDGNRGKETFFTENCCSNILDNENYEITIEYEYE